jgi:competence ComEA-like helix-hairpin-helix protein
MVSMMRWLTILACGALALTAQELREGEGRESVEKICKGCHEMARSVSKRQDRDAWQQTMAKMTAFGMKSSEEDYGKALDYLARLYPAGETPPVNLNQAAAVEIESRLNLRRSQAAALLAYRAKHGPFKKFEDLKKIPQLDYAALEAKRDRIVF